MDDLRALQSELERVKRELADLSLLVGKLSRSADSGFQSTQRAVNDLQNSVDLIFTHVQVPNVIFKPGVRHVIK